MPRYDDRYGSTRLYVGKLSSRTRSRDLEHIFSKYGRVRAVEMKQNYAFVDFSDARDADDARHYLDGKDVDGHPITVEFAKGMRRGPGGVREYTGRGGPAPGSGRCFNCGIDGHWARDCKSGDWNNKCYGCGERGHIEKNCHNPKKSTHSQSPVRSRSPRRLSRSRSYSRSRSPVRRRGRDVERRVSRSRSPVRRGRAERKSRSPRSESPKPKRSKTRNRSPPPDVDSPRGRSPSTGKYSPKEASSSPYAAMHDRSPSPYAANGRDRSPSPRGDRSPVEDDDNVRSPRGSTSP